MTAIPDFLADGPAARPAGPDLLSDLLGAVRLAGSVFMNARFTQPFCVDDARRSDAAGPVAKLRNMSILHLVLSGRCRLEMDGQGLEVLAGDILFLPLARSHRFLGGEAPSVHRADQLMRPSVIEGVWTIEHGGGGAEVRMICGYVETSELLFVPLLRTLPPLIVERPGAGEVGALLAGSVREIAALVDRATPGAPAILSRLMEAVFIEMLRRQVTRLPEGTTGWLAAFADPIAARALQLIHAEPARRWTIDELARRAGTSRTVLAERFKALLGRPPIEYLAGWRIQLAAERLRTGHETIPAIAAAVGYESEAAFARAFKRLTGTTPGGWRRA